MASISEGYERAATVTKSDSTVVDCRGIYVGGTGDVAVVCRSGDTAVVFKAVPVGTILPIRAYNIMSTNTTATLMLALY